MIIQESFAFEANVSVLCSLRRQTTVLNKAAFDYHTIAVHVCAIINNTQVLARTALSVLCRGCMGPLKCWLILLLLCALFCVAKAMEGEFKQRERRGEVEGERL